MCYLWMTFVCHVIIRIFAPCIVLLDFIYIFVIAYLLVIIERWVCIKLGQSQGYYLFIICWNSYNNTLNKLWMASITKLFQPIITRTENVWQGRVGTGSSSSSEPATSRSESRNTNHTPQERYRNVQSINTMYMTVVVEMVILGVNRFALPASLSLTDDSPLSPYDSHTP